MKLDRWKNAASAALLAFLAALGGVGCLMTGMRLEANVPALVLGCGIMAVVFCLFFNTRFGLVPVCVAALLIGYWWQEGTLRYSVESMIYRMTILYDQGYGWGVVQWSEWHLLPEDVTAALLLVALPVVIAVGLTAVKGRFGLLGGAVALLPLMACLILKDTVPHEAWLLMLLFAVLMILLTQNVRSRDVAQGSRLVFLLILPLLLALAAMFLLCPQDTYNGQEGAQKLEDLVLRLLDRKEMPELFEELVQTYGDQDRVVNLERVGSRTNRNDRIMTVRAEEDATVYLRGCAYDIYDGTSWSSTAGWNSWSLYYGSAGGERKSLTIETDEVHSVLYFTYSPVDSEHKIMGGRVRNEEDLTRYTVYYQDPIAYDVSLDDKNDEIGGQQLSEYLQLPDSTRARAEQILYKKVGVPTETISAGQVWKNAMLICQWVSGRADYDLNTGKMPADEDDFAMWFLEKGKTGYCTHFASAAVVLLRAAGIPAQYVTGYLVETEAGKAVTVTEEQAHAWVEVFINGVGWVVLEPTPSRDEETTGGGTVRPPAPTEPQQTEAPTRPEETTVPDRPSETTEATDASKSTGAGSSETTEPFSHPTDTATVPASWISGTGGADGGTPARKGMLTALLWLLGIVLALLLILGQWRLRVALVRSAANRGGANERALARWHIIERQAKLTGRTPPEDAFWIAQKARFSQHTVSHEELRQLADVIEAQQILLKKKPFPNQLLYTLILAVY